MWHSHIVADGGACEYVQIERKKEEVIVVQKDKKQRVQKKGRRKD